VAAAAASSSGDGSCSANVPYLSMAASRPGYAKTSKIYTRNAERGRLSRMAVSKVSWDGVGTQLLEPEEPAEGVAECGSHV
jgi:hypothetical protein